MRHRKQSKTSIDLRHFKRTALSIGLGFTTGLGVTSATYAQEAPSVTDEAPLSSMVAVRLAEDPSGEAPTNIADYVKTRVAEIDANGGIPDEDFPLPQDTTDTVRTAGGLAHNVVVSWLDPLTTQTGAAAPHYGANNDFIAYFGNGWDADWTEDPESGERVVGSAPQFNGDPGEGLMWVNHEYISNDQPTTTSAPTGQHLTLATWLSEQGVLTNDVTSDTWSQEDVDTYIRYYKRQLGGSWFSVKRNEESGEWNLVPEDNARRYDATDNTLLQVTGYTLTEPDNLDDGTTLPDGQVVGILADCSGGVSPWGTIITAEENAQDYYGDAETCWTSSQQFVPGEGCDVGANITITVEPSTAANFGQISNPNERHNRDIYGFLAEIDAESEPNQPYDAATGSGHRKIGLMGRARWENASFAVDENWKLVPGQQVVVYGGNDRRSGRVYKLVSAAPYEEGMTRSQVRALLDEGTLYVAHFEGLDNRTGYTLLDESEACTAAVTESDAAILENCKRATLENPGQGRWIEMSTTSTDLAPNAAALGTEDKTVGAALQDAEWNNIGGFPDDNTVLSALFTAANKLGVMELNRPEDVEWNAKDPIAGGPSIYVAFTKNGRQVALDQTGVLFDPQSHTEESPTRIDKVGSIARMVEADPANPGASPTFSYSFVWHGVEGTEAYDAANPDNLAIDEDGGVWFGTDGNFGTNGTADAQYYLDVDTTHTNTFLTAFRFVAGPSDSEATGPAWNSDETAFFFNVQHPGEDLEGPGSNWPHTESDGTNGGTGGDTDGGN